MCRYARILGPIAVALAAGLHVGGCASSEPIPRRSSGLIVGTQGAGSEVFFHGVQVSGADLIAGDELSRRDELLAISVPITAFEAEAWPADPAPSLDSARRLHLPRQPDTYLYFNSQRLPRGARYHFREGFCW